jgi:molybdopterin-guanine dinucleotide biosynthesis protein A
MLEPLHAVYQNAPMLAAIKEGVRKGAGKISDVLSRLQNVYFLPVARIMEIDPGLKTFTNINTPEKLKRTEKLLYSKR